MLDQDNDLKVIKSITLPLSQKKIQKAMKNNIASLDLSSTKKFHEKKIKIIEKKHVFSSNAEKKIQKLNIKSEENAIEIENTPPQKNTTENLENEAKKIEIKYQKNKIQNIAKNDESNQKNTEINNDLHIQIINFDEEIKKTNISPILEDKLKTKEKKLKITPTKKKMEKQSLYSEKIEKNRSKSPKTSEKPPKSKLISRNIKKPKDLMKSVIFKDFEPNFHEISFYEELAQTNSKTFEKLLNQIKDESVFPEEMSYFIETLSKFNDINSKTLKSLFNFLSKGNYAPKKQSFLIQDNNQKNNATIMKENTKMLSSSSNKFENLHYFPQKLLNSTSPYFKPQNNSDLINITSTLYENPSIKEMETFKQPPRMLKAFSHHLTEIVPFPRMDRRGTIDMISTNSLENFEKNPILETANYLIHNKFIKEKENNKRVIILNPTVAFKLISMVYSEAAKKIKKGEKLDEFLILFYEFFVKRYGLKTIAEAKILQLLHSCHGNELKDNVKIVAFRNFLGLEKNNNEKHGGIENYLKNIMLLDENLKRVGFNINIERISTDFETVLRVFQEKFENKIEEKKYKEGLMQIHKMMERGEKNNIDKILEIMERLETN